MNKINIVFWTVDESVNITGRTFVYSYWHVVCHPSQREVPVWTLIIHAHKSLWPPREHRG